MFRMIGQVLGVALSSAVIQAIISKDLGRLIIGPNASEVGPDASVWADLTFTDHLHHPPLHLVHPAYGARLS